MAKRRIVLVFVVLLLVGVSGFSLVSSTPDWSMFRGDLTHSGTTTINSTANSAKLLWNFTTGAAVHSSPAVSNGCIYFGSKDSYIYCLNVSNGQKLWSFPTGQEIVASPTITEGHVFLGSYDGWLYCLDATDGSACWVKWVGWNFMSSPAVLDGKLFVGSGHHDLLCLNASDGSEIWRHVTEKSVFSSPATSDGVLYFASDDFTVYAINATNGEEIWRSPNGCTDSSPAVANDCVYVGSYEGYVFCLNASTGKISWSFQTADRIISSPAVADGYIYVGSEDNNIYCLNASNGQKIWQTQTGFWVCSSPAIADGNLYVGSTDYNIYCLNATTGTIKWAYPTGNQIYSSPAIANGTLFIGSFDHNIYALALENTDAPAVYENQNLTPKTTILFDAIACLVAAAAAFTALKYVKSAKTNKTAQTQNRRSLKLWLTFHLDTLCILAIVVTALTSFFWNLGGSFLWAADEQTYSQMAVHMVKSGDYLNPYAFGESALWTGKPPLLMWLMSLSYQTFGINNFAARFWVPLFGALALVFVFFLGKRLYNRRVGLLGALVLCTFSTFYSFATHAMIDVPLLCLVTGSIYFFLVSEDTKNGGWYAVLSGVCFGLAYLTKQTGALLIPAIIIVYLVVSKRRVEAPVTKRFGLFLGVALLVLSPWLLYMTYSYSSEFWTVFVYSTFTRASSALEGHSGGPLYYFDYLVTGETLLWAVLLPFAVGLSAYFAVKRSKADALVFVWVVVVLTVFTIAQTKLYYYILPAYPAFALAISSLIYKLSSKVSHSVKNHKLRDL